VFFFKKEDDAKAFVLNLKGRVEGYGLKLNDDKTHVLSLRKNEQNSFNFLGFTFYWGKQQNKRVLKIKTQKEKLIRAFREFDVWIKNNRNRLKLSSIWKLAQSKIRGHFNYYGFAMNNLKLNHFLQEATKSLFKWLNRRSQKSSYTWEGFLERIKNFPLVKPWESLKLKPLGSIYA